MKSESSQSQRWQSTAESVLLLLLIGGGSILAFKALGRDIINRFATVTRQMFVEDKLETPFDHSQERAKLRKLDDSFPPRSSARAEVERDYYDL